MKPTDLALLRVPGAPSLSPDGSRVAVAVTRMDVDADVYRADLWVAATDGATPPRRFTGGQRDSEPRWSPDGQWLAFLRAVPGDEGRVGKPQLHVIAADGGEARRITDHPLGVSGPQWRPDSRAIAYLARVPEEGRYGTAAGVGPERERPRRITTLRYRLDDVGFIADRRSHVFVVDPFAEGAEPQQLSQGDFDHDDVTWSPDGQQLALVTSRPDDAPSELAFEAGLVRDVYLTRPDSGGLRRRSDGTTSAARPAFSSDGATIYYIGLELGHNGLDFAGRPPGLWSVPVDGSAPPRRLTDPEVAELDDGQTRPLLVDADGVTTGRLHRGAVELVRIGSDGVPDVLLGGHRQVHGYDRAGQTVVATVAHPTSAGELVAVRDGAERVLTSFGAELERGAALRPMAELTAVAPDGYPVHGWLVRPTGTGPHPVLLMIHGGPFTQYGWTLFDEAQLYAGAGYAVVMGNPRGAAGYGEAHGRAIVGAMGGRDVDDLLALLDAGLADPDCDADRVGVLGGSYGGWMTSWLAAHHGERFRAAISERALNAWDSFTGSSDIGYFFTRGYPGSEPEQIRDQSPFTFADRIAIPMLLIHSEQDWRCPLEQAQRLFVALKLRGATAELLLFPGEGHELSRSGRPSHRLARFEAILDWWGRHLGPADPAVGAAGHPSSVGVGEGPPRQQ